MSAPTAIPDYTDNEVHKLSGLLHTLVTEYQKRNLDVATGFFSPDVWNIIGRDLQTLESFRLMIGKEPDIKLGKEGLDLVKYYKKQIKQEIEGAELTLAKHKQIDELIDFLTRDSVQVRLYDEPFLHAKAYIFDDHAIVGSSNLTVNGLLHNSELNMVSKSRAVAQDLKHSWFNKFWNNSKEYKQDLLEVLQKSKFGTYQFTPFDVFIKVLYENYKEILVEDNTSENQVVELAKFQEEGFKVAVSILEKHDAVMIADAVGLGKTYMGLGLLEEFVIKRRRKGSIPKALVVCPAQLERLVWKPKLEDHGIPATIVSMESMGREDFDWKKYINYDVIVVDESHNFRKPTTGRYINLQQVIASGKPNKKVVLMTATPVNNSIYDLYYQILLMVKSNESHYALEGINNLGSFFDGIVKGKKEFYDLAEHTIVRRSRMDVKRRQDNGEEVVINGVNIKFPERKLHKIEYSFLDMLGGFYDEFLDRIESLTLAPYNLERYKKDKKDTKELNRREALAGIFKTNYLKRLESSLCAFMNSLKNQIDFQKAFFAELKNNMRLLDAGSNRKIKVILRTLGEDEEKYTQKTEKIFESLESVATLDYDITKIEVDIKKDIESLQWLIDTVEKLQNGKVDAKLDTLKEAMLEHKGKKIILFSYYHDTAQNTYEYLTQDQDWLQAMGNPKIETITGMSSAQDRNRVVKHFAPKANRADLDDIEFAKLLAEPVDILISTDVLSEGQNLQDAGILMNIDLHWNPVRMIQRAGRIDRLGSEFATLAVYNTFPEQGLENILNLVSRLQSRIKNIDHTIGLDSSVLGEAILDKSLEELKRLRNNDQNILEDLEKQNDLYEIDDMRIGLSLALNMLGKEYIEELPYGLHSAHYAPTEARGVFFAFKIKDKTVWKIYDIHNPEAEPKSSKHEIFKYIQAEQDVPRAKNPEQVEVYGYLEKAIEDIIKNDIRLNKKSEKVVLKGMGKKIKNALLDMENLDKIDASLKEYILGILESNALASFEKNADLKNLWQQYESKTILWPAFAENLQQFCLDNRIYATINKRKNLQTLKAEDIRLVAYEWLV